MGKRALKKYLEGLEREGLSEQLLDLYNRFPVVKEYYDFVFDPKEEKRIQEAKVRISNEYFPVKRRKPKARRSVAQKFIKHFITLGVASHMVADLMLYNLEVAQAFAGDRKVPDAFYRSMLNSFSQAVQYISLNGLLPDFKDRVRIIYETVQEQEWLFQEGFSRALDILD
ncbi:DUF6155 family protein [Flavobacteriaceae bacterium 3-367]|uniref:DUF6155 family protein n=1 Tax=Eudoraea algarum TaxID=3417568 RepID=UPI00328692A4